MSAVPTVSQPPNKNFIADFEYEAKVHSIESMLWKTASIVVLVATFALAAFVLVGSYLATGGAAMPFLTVVLLPCACFLSMGAIWLWKKSKCPEECAEIANGYIQKEKELRLELSTQGTDQASTQLDREQIRNRLHLYGVQRTETADEFNTVLEEMANSLPKKKDGSTPTSDDALNAYLHVLAQIQFWMDNFHAKFKESEELHNPKESDKPPSDQDQINQHNKAHSIFEEAVLFSALSAAHLLNVLSSPYDTKEVSWRDLGDQQTQTLDGRIKLGIVTYFIFKNGDRIDFPLLKEKAEELEKACREAEKESKHLTHGQVQALRNISNLLTNPQLAPSNPPPLFRRCFSETQLKKDHFNIYDAALTNSTRVFG